MKQLNLMLASIVLTCFALCPATALADDELEVFIEVFDSISDIEGDVTEMHGPGEEDGHGDGDQRDSDDMRVESDGHDSDDYDSDGHDSDDMHAEGDEHEAGDDEIASFGDDGLIASASDLDQIAAFGEDAQVRAMDGWRLEVFGNDAGSKL